MTYDYIKILAEHTIELASIKGHIIKNATANIVGGEINIVFLLINDTWYSIHGLIGSEIIGIKRTDNDLKSMHDLRDNTHCNLPVLNQFIGLKIIQSRQIGEAWNGHGFEFSFEGVPEKTLLIQSIYTGSEPKDFNDCLRVGVGNYTYRINPMIFENRNEE